MVACGYADGYPRHAPTGTPVWVDGVLTRTLGTVSMDMLAVDPDALSTSRIGRRRGAVETPAGGRGGHGGRNVGL